jgi:hypothetical protein
MNTGAGGLFGLKLFWSNQGIGEQLGKWCAAGQLNQFNLRNMSGSF